MTAVSFGWGLMAGLSAGAVLNPLASFRLDQRLTGADAERWSASQLQRLERDGWRVVKDLPTDFGNIDHAVVGHGVGVVGSGV